MWRRVGMVVVLVGSLLAVSAPADAAVHLTYVHSKKRTMGPFAAGVRRTAMCPAGTQVIGGGGWVSDSFNGESSLMASFPIDGPDRGKRPDDGWRVLGNNNSTATVLEVQAWAVCADRGRYAYRTSPVSNVNNAAQASNIAVCAVGEKVTGGGGSVTGTHVEIELGGTIPEDVDVDNVFDNGWSVVFNNDSGVQQQFQAFAICSKSGGPYSYTAGEEAISGSGSFTHEDPCPSGEKVVSGGFFAHSSNRNFEVQVLRPIDDDDANSRPDDGWRTGAGIVSPSTESESRIVCRRV